MSDEPGPFDVEPPEILREAYLADAIDLETFERFVGFCFGDQAFAYPQVILDFARRRWQPSDEPGAAVYYDPRDGRPTWEN